MFELETISIVVASITLTVGAIYYHLRLKNNYNRKQAFLSSPLQSRTYSTRVRKGRTLIMVVALVGFLFFGLAFRNATATTEWSRITPLGFDSHVRSVVQTNDGGYILAGHTQIHGGTDRQALLVKTDSSGNFEWNKTYGDIYTDEAHFVLQAIDGGYIVVGVSWSSTVTGHFWAFKVDASGKMQWNKTYGGQYNDNAWSMVKTSDGGYAMAGFTNNYGALNGDYYLVKIDASGTAQWNRTYGTPGNDVAYSVIQTSDGGYAMSGRQNGHQCWLVKTDSSGTMQWNKTYGDVRVSSTGYSLIQTSDTGYAIGGFTESFNESKNTPYDFWLVKTDSNGEMQWNKTYGGVSEDIARSVVQTKDGGYALAGYTESTGAGTQDVWLVKTDSLGNMQWSQTFGETNTDVANSMILTKDGGFLLGGNTESFGLASAAFLLLKTDGAGLSTPGTSNPETSAWVPQPSSVAVATVAAALATSGASIVVAAAIAPTGMQNSLTKKIGDLIPNTIKQWLAAFMASKRKLEIDEQIGSPFLPTKSEMIAYVVSIVVLGFSFSYVKVDTLSQIILVLPMILGTSIIVGFVKTYIMIAYSRMRGVWTEQKLWYFGLATFLLTTLVFRVPFSSPSRSVHYAPKFTKRLGVILSSAEVLISLAFAGCFYILLLSGFKAIGSIGLAMCIIGAFFDTFPIAPMNGRTIFDYSKTLWIVLFTVTLALYTYWLLLM